MNKRPQISRMDSVEVVDGRDLEQEAQEAALFSMIIAQQQQRKLERLQDKAYKRAEFIQDAVSDPLLPGGDLNMSNDEYERVMAELELELEAGEGIKRRHRRGTKRHRRHHRGTKRRRPHRRGTKKHHRRHRSTKKHRRHRRGR